MKKEELSIDEPMSEEPHTTTLTEWKTGTYFEDNKKDFDKIIDLLRQIIELNEDKYVRRIGYKCLRWLGKTNDKSQLLKERNKTIKEEREKTIKECVKVLGKYLSNKEKNYDATDVILIQITKEIYGRLLE